MELMENPCLKTGITVQTEDGKKIHGDLFMYGGELMIRGSARGICDDISREAEMVVRVTQHSKREKGTWNDFAVDPLSITSALEEYLVKWTPRSLDIIKGRLP